MHLYKNKLLIVYESEQRAARPLDELGDYALSTGEDGQLRVDTLCRSQEKQSDVLDALLIPTIEALW
jgi:hypothetical protein